MIVPPRIRPGDTIGVCAPAGPVAADRLSAGLAFLSDHFRIKLGGVVAAAAASASLLPPPSLQRGYLAATDSERSDELNQLLRDPDVRAVIPARGGYGIMRILDRLDATALQADPKPIVGFSDATALLSWALGNGVRGVHGPVVTQLASLSSEDKNALIHAITDPSPPPPFVQMQPIASTTGNTTGVLIPSNLIMRCHLVGTPWALPSAGTIALLEEVGERPYAIDRCLTQLALAKALGWEAAIIGDFTRCTDPPHQPGAIDDPAPALAVVSERLLRAGVRALGGAPVGHGLRNRCVPFGGRVRVDFSLAQLDFVDGCVS